MNIELHTPNRSERGLIRQMMELYLYDFSEFDGSDLNEHGQFGYGDLDYFWFEPTHAAFLVTVAEKLAGFVLVDNEVVLDDSERSITEFCILRKYRRQGVGKFVATAVFDQFPANWEVRVIRENVPAQKFWRQIIAEYTGGHFEETVLDNDDWRGAVFSFDNGRTAAKPPENS